MPIINILSHHDAERVLYSAEVSDDVPFYMRMRDAVQQAVAARAYLLDANLRGAYLSGADLRGAHLIGADLRGAHLIGAYLIDARLSGADLRGAHLIGAYLIDARLSGADLSGANLIGANLIGANLIGADLRGAHLRYDIKSLAAPARRVTRSDGYEFFLWPTDAGWRVAAGCRFFSMGEAREHWTRTRGDTDLGIESLDILDFFQRHIDRVTVQQEAGGE